MLVLKNPNLRLDFGKQQPLRSWSLVDSSSRVPVLQTLDSLMLRGCFSKFALFRFSQEVMRSDTTDQPSGSARAWSLWTGIQPSRLALQN